MSTLRHTCTRPSAALLSEKRSTTSARRGCPSFSAEVAFNLGASSPWMARGLLLTLEKTV